MGLRCNEWGVFASVPTCACHWPRLDGTDITATQGLMGPILLLILLVSRALLCESPERLIVTWVSAAPHGPCKEGAVPSLKLSWLLLHGSHLLLVCISSKGQHRPCPG